MTILLRYYSKNHNQPVIENLIIKYLTRSISKSEMSQLIDWLKDGNNDEIFEVYTKINYSLNHIMTKYNPSNIKKELLQQIRKDKREATYTRVRSTLKYAALIVIFLGASYFLINDSLFNQTNDLISPTENSFATTDKIILKLANGESEVIDTNGNSNIVDSNGNIVGTQNGNILQYGNNDGFVDELVYNSLSIPFGKRFQIVLSDGTKVHLNAGSSLKYPVNFIPGLNRQVYLNGEAYFDVTESKKDHFIVSIDEMDIKVLGTEFNVKHYPENKDINTVLVEGSIKLSQNSLDIANTNTVKLKPGYLATWNISNDEMAVNKTDTSFYTSWRNGVIRFKSESFKDICKTLERHFNVTIESSYSYLDKQVYTASFYDGENIDDILGYFQVDTEFDFKINDNKIHITNPLTNY